MRHVKCKYGCLRIRGSYKGVDECSDLMGYDDVTLGECFLTFRRITASSSLRVKHSMKKSLFNLMSYCCCTLDGDTQYVAGRPHVGGLRSQS
jgi:hypothetical protein